MKNLLLLVGLCFIFTSSYTHTEGIPGEPKQLTERMYNFFTKTLKENYNINNEANLYRKFLTDYFQQENQPGSLHLAKYNFKVDTVKLIAINHDLFIRDSLHYYYFYKEVFEVNKADYEKEAEKIIQKYIGAPLSLWQAESENDPKYIRPTLNKSPQVYLVNSSQKKGFLYQMMMQEKKPSLIVSAVNDANEQLGEVGFNNMAWMSQSKSAMKELDRKPVRKLVVVVFWKFLCIKAGIGFHTLPQK